MYDSRMGHVTREELELGLPALRRSPRESGRLELIVRRPAVGKREVVNAATLDLAEGLVGDSWKSRPSSRLRNRGPHPDMQLTLMNARAIALIAGETARWPLAGDQLYVDFDVSGEHLPPGTRLAIGDAIVEVTAQPHTGCVKFTRQFGADATKFVNSPAGRALNLRGINARVIVGGAIRTGDPVTKVAAAEAAATGAVA